MAADNDNNLVLTVSSDMTAAERGIKKFVGDIATGSAQIEKQFQKMGRGIDNSMVSAMQTRIDKMVGIGTAGAKEWTGALADQGKELERLRARYSPLFATITNYKTAVNDIKRAHALGAISATEMTSAITKERQAALASTAAIKGRNAALADTPAQGRHSQGASAFNTSNLAAQFQDIGVTAAMGMSPLQIALQQGTQISAVLGPMGAAGAVKSLGAAFLSVISPVSLVTIGLVAGAAAAIQYFGSMESGSEKSEKALKKEAELIDAVVQKWGDALPALKAYNDERGKLASGKDIKETAGIAAEEQWSSLRKQLSEVNIEFTDMTSRLAQLGKDENQVGNLQRSFNDLASGIEDGTASAELAKKVQDELLALVKDGANPEIAAFAKTFEALGKAIATASGKASEFKTEAAVLVDLVKKLGPLGQLGPILSGDGKFLINANDQQNYRAQQEANKNPLIESNGRMMGVPTPESKPIQIGIEPDKAPKKAETAAEKAKNAYRDLLKTADDRIAQLKLESDLLGQYGSATDTAKFRLDLLQQAEDKGRSLSPAQRAEIEKKVEVYGRYAEVLRQAANPTIENPQGLIVNVPTPERKPIQLGDEPSKAAKKAETAAEKAKNAYRDLLKSADDRIGSLKLETELLGQYGAATDAARFRLDLLQQSEDKGRSLSEAQKAEIESKVELYKKYSEALGQAKLKQDLLDDAKFAGMSKQDQAITQRLRSYGLSEDLGGDNANAIRNRFQQEEIADATKSFLSDFSSGVVSGGKDIGEAFVDAVKNAAANAMQKSLDALFEQIGNGLASALLGGKGGAAASPVGAVASTASSFAAPVGAVTRSALPAAGGSGASQAWSFWKSKGLTDEQAAGVLGNIKAESAFNPGAIGDGGAAKGLFQWNDRGPAMMAAVGKDWKNNPMAQHEFAYSELMGSEGKAWNALKGAGTTREATAAFAGFERPQGFSWNNPEGAHNFSGRLDGAEEALSKFGGTAGKATEGLGKLDTGLNAITQNFGAGKGLGGAVGGFDWSSLTSSAWKPNTTLGGFLGLAGGGRVSGPGTATSDSIPTMLSDGEHVTRAAMVKKYGPLLDAINSDRVPHLAAGGLVSPRVGAPVAPRLNSRQSAAANNGGSSSMVVHINGASGDPHVKELVRQGVAQALSEKNDNDRRGGWGTQQQRYTAQKG
jgi:ribosome recycling factor